MAKKPVLLCIMDGFGWVPEETFGNAVVAAKKPHLDALMAKYPMTTINASGMAVGLPEGQMGNSEVGHTNMGAGRIVYQQLTLITKSTCYASGFISIARPLVELGLAPKDYPFSCTGISGYSGGGKKMIAEYESADRPAHSKLDAPKSYGLSLAHKHLPEMKEISGLAHTPMFVPVVCDYYCGMQVLVPLDLTVAGTTAEAVAAGLADYYKDAATVKVHAMNEPLPENGLYSNAMAGTDRMELYLTVNAAGDQMMLVSLFDNLGKGSSGAAVQCMNLMLGLPETQGLE